MKEDWSLGLSAGITDRFQFGMSFGSTNLIDENLEWYLRPEAKLKYLIVDENLSMPALALGLNTQGSSIAMNALQRYEIKALGLYGAMSKNWKSPLVISIATVLIIFLNRG